MQLSKKLLLLVFAIGMLGGVVGYALSSYVARIYIEITQPAAVIKTFTSKIDAAPYQFVKRYGIEVAEVHQNSDRVEYTVTVRAKNFEKWKVCIWVGYLTTKLYENCTVEGHGVLKFTIPKVRTMNGVFYIYATIYGKTTSSRGTIEIEIVPRALP